MTKSSYFLIIFGLFLFLEVCRSLASRDENVLKLRAFKKADDLKSKNSRNCASVHKRSVTQTETLHVRHPRSTDARTPGEHDAYALYLNGKRGVLKFNANRNTPLDLPHQTFTLEIWIKPEGGQTNPSIIAGLVDKCSPTKRGGWKLGIRSVDEKGSKDPRIYFSVETAQSYTHIVSSNSYKHGQWTHVAATYDGRQMELYIDGTKMAVERAPREPLIVDASWRCKHLYMGGDVREKVYFRGLVDKVVIWNIKRNHSDIRYSMRTEILDKSEKNIVISDGFSSLEKWDIISGRPSIKIISSNSRSTFEQVLHAPPCGHTVCDNPTLIKSYAQNWQMRRGKNLKYRVINVMNDDGSNPTITKQQIQTQDGALRMAFKPYNISWNMVQLNVRNTTLRARTILFGCDPLHVGNGHCNPECRHQKTGNDGGDCDDVETICANADKGNGVCDPLCNVAYHSWDGGDCCNPAKVNTSEVCFDPFSPNRAYMSVDEYKRVLNADSSHHLNVFFAYWMSRDLIGVATFPWEKQVFGVLGGTVIQPDSFGIPGKTEHLVHEFGHNLGLWHVHHGVSEMECDDPCREIQASLEVGDMCADTNPTPQNAYCRDPKSGSDACGPSGFLDTPYRNYMSYADGDCTDHFSTHQVARMHCYVDLVYQSWGSLTGPSPVPLPPKVVSAEKNSVTVAWIPPLGDGASEIELVCKQCLQDNALQQYASSATSSILNKSRVYWNPKQATGPPDAELCEPSTKAWMAEVSACKARNCYLDVGFQIPVKPRSLKLWAVWNTKDGIKDVVLTLVDGSKHSLGQISTFCDMPYTATVDLHTNLKKIRIYTSNQFVSIDAVQVTSQPDHNKCRACKKVTYRVNRFPPMTKPVTTQGNVFTDRSVERGQSYTYTVTALRGNAHSHASPSLFYTQGQAFCGDGVVNRGNKEQCDDGNFLDHDGCTGECVIEKDFHCRGEPSLCYRYENDGICEEFERQTSVADCGFYTPPGFSDQWAASAVANPYYQTEECPASVVVGPPATNTKCQASFERFASWYPCGHLHEESDFWLKVSFHKPAVTAAVVVYLASDGINEFDLQEKEISLTLIDSDNKSHPIGPNKIRIACSDNPVIVPVKHDLTQPFYRTKDVMIRFSSYHIAFAAVALRHYSYMDPLTIQTCSKTELYNPGTGHCVPYMCERPGCGKYMIKHGTTDCSGAHDGDKCVLTCDNGYRLKSHERTVVCAGGAWRDENIGCLAINCSQPQIPLAVIDCPEGTLFGMTCKFDCRAPAKKQGQGHTVMCQADGTWTRPEAFCQPMCSIPRIPRHSSHISKSCGGSVHRVGTKCRFKCKKGYHVSGQSIKRRISRLTCGEDGLWDGDECVPISCPRIDPVLHGMYNCTASEMAGSKCTLKCPAETQMQKISCTYNGEWSSGFRICMFGDGQCAPLMDTDSVRFVCSSQLIGSVCKVLCKNTNQVAVLTKPANKVSARSRVKRRIIQERIRRITCTGLSQWFPDPTLVSCVDECLTRFVGDGWCDGKNNHAGCDWDGGDCCASSVDSGIVQALPSCGGHCKCKDPTARENLFKKNSNLELSSKRYYQHQGFLKHRRLSGKYLKTLYG